MAKKKSHEKEISVTPIDHIRDMDVTEIMKSSYINYAMNVIIARALPDVRDGLKPVHRRVLYAMKELKLTGDAKKKKSARIVGDIIGKYHPHGDSAAYETMVRMAQDFSYRYPLVEGQGNFGSIDGDPAAAMRYTEAKLTPIAEELLNGLDKNTVNFIDNYDSTEKEPVLLPSRYPNLLVNGSTGIAVGMATNMPPHHLGEVVDTTVAYIDNPNIDDEKLISYLNGPDFPTGGVIVGRDEIKKAYLTGKGKITLRGKVTVEEGNSGKPEVVINDIPYGINKPKLLEKIATLIRDGRIEDIMDIRDETDKTGMRIVIELKKGANPKKLINQLFSLTDLQTTFGIINLAVVNGSPEILTLRQILEHYLVFQREVIERRSKFELDKAKARAHILEGLVIVGENVDQVVALIRASRNTETAKQKLMKQFNLSEIQAQAILDLRLHRITGIEVSKTKADLKEIYKSIKRLEKILSTQKEMDNVIKEELLQIKEKFSDQRRTIIIDDINQHNDSFNEMIRKTLIISISKKGYVHAVDEGLFNRQSRGAKGSSGVQITDDDYTQHLFPIATDQVLGLFTSEGQFYRVPASELPEISRNQRGTLVYNLAAMSSDAKVTSYLVFNKDEEHSTLTFITKLGLIKKMDASEILNGRNGILAIKLKKEDELLGVFTTEENEEFILATRKGKSIRFNTSDVRPMGRVAGGVNTISMDKNDYVVGVDLVKNGDFLIVLSELGHGKRTPISEFRLQKRLGKGVRVATFTKKHGELAAIQMATEEQDVLITTDSGKMIRLHVGDFAVMTRDTSGGKVIELNDGDKILSIAVIAKQEE